MALRYDSHCGIGKNLSHCFHGAVSEPANPGEKRQQLNQNFFGGEQHAARKKIVKLLNFSEVSVLRIRQSNPIECVGKNRLHVVLLGTP
jgi:hypothetical protein